MTTPSNDVAAKFQRPDDAFEVLWFKNGDEKYGACYSCEPATGQARSFQIEGRDIVVQECEM